MGLGGKQEMHVGLKFSLRVFCCLVGESLAILSIV